MIVNSHQDSHASSQRNEKERIGPGGSRALAKYVQEAHASALAFSLTLLNHQFITSTPGNLQVQPLLFAKLSMRS